ncbi:thrombospondin type 3 repeat-containing protein [Portibacter lacus]|nr:thrombospondin type 3 repeat-containing protein [Portibacter lacus]
MKTFLALVIVFTCWEFSLATTCPTTIFLNQSDIDDFIISGCDSVSGNIQIGEFISDISFLSQVKYISGNLTFENFIIVEGHSATNVVRYIGGDLNFLYETTLGEELTFNSLEYIGGSHVLLSRGLDTITGFNALKRIGGNLNFIGGGTEAFVGFQNLQHIGGSFEISSQPTTDISGFKSLRQIDGPFTMSSLPIVNLFGLKRLKFMSEINVFDCPNLINIFDPFNEIEIISEAVLIQNNPNFRRINLPRIKEIRDEFEINLCPSFLECCQLKIWQSQGIVGMVVLSNNGANCSNGGSIQFCFNDNDQDGWAFDVDNCPYDANFDQSDIDQDGIGNACDNCVFTPNSNQEDSDFNGIGDACETSPSTNIGINTTDPKASLHITGSLFIDDLNGLVIRGIDSTCYRLTIDLLGALKTQQIVCDE